MYYKNKIINKPFKSLKNDNLLDANLFSKELTIFLKEEKIPISIFGYNLVFIKPSSLNKIILDKYLDIFNDYYKKIKIMNIEEIINIDKNTNYLNINNNYIDYYYYKKNELEILRINNNIFDFNIHKILNYIITNIYKPKKIIIFGNNEEIPKLAYLLNHNYNILTTFPEFPQHYILEEYKKL